jgi:succinate-semialdehyde dehydrogenase / glutarate-semialdehyde dehydrogenase
VCLKSLLQQSAYIDGEWISHAEKRIEVTNPSTNEIIGSIPSLSIPQIIYAIEKARIAFNAWKKTPANIRSELLYSLADCMMTNKEDLANIITIENGKPLKESRSEIAYSASFVRWYAEEAKRIYGTTVPANTTSQQLLIQKIPIGVCALITPWNFPCAMLARKLAPALAAGCSVIAKPAENTPFSALALAKLTKEVGFPDGVLNVVTGEADIIGKVLCMHPEIKKLSFTGSTKTGRLLMEQCSPTLKKLSLELGGNAPFLVFDDANIDDAVTGAINSKFRNAGQTCIASNRFLIQQNIADEFTKQLQISVQELITGDGLKPETDIGPIISLNAVQKIQSLISDAKDKGATIVQGKIPSGDSNFVEPIILTGITPKMQIWHTEIFGPVIAISTFTSEEQAIELANDTIHGLAAYVYTQNPSRIWNLPKLLEYGMIGMNSGKISMAQVPFGGLKQSGIGREGGQQGINEYLEVQYICHTT